MLARLTLALLPTALLGASISVNSTVIRAGDAVDVSWKTDGLALNDLAPMHVVFSSDDDHVHRWRVEPEGASSLWVGQFSPPIADASQIYMGPNPMDRGIATEGTPPFTVPAPVKFISGTQLARGHHAFKISNMRAPVNWVLFSGSLTNASDFNVLAISPTLTLLDEAAPMHLRLSRTSSVEQMRVSWTSAQSGSAAHHVVQWGESASTLDRVTPAATSHTYTASDLCGFPANESGFHSPGFFHEAVLELASDAPTPAPTRFYYRVGSAAFGWSAVQSFTPPAPASPHTPLSVIITADMVRVCPESTL